MTKSITTVWLIALLTGLMSMCAATAQAQNPTSGTAGPLTWKYDTDMRILTISGKGEIPNYDWEHPVPWQEHSQDIQKLVVEEGVTGIGNESFRNTRNLVSATFPKSLTRIGDEAFASCLNLPMVTLPAGVTSIGDYAFSYCGNLALATLPAGLQVIGRGAFDQCKKLSSVVIPAGVISIGDGAFAGCSSLPTITVADGNTKYVAVDGVLLNKEKTQLVQYPAGRAATSYVIPKEVTSIEAGAFEAAEKLTAITIPVGIVSIGRMAFESCFALTTISIPATVKTIGANAFGCCQELSEIKVEAANTAYTSVDGVLFDKAKKTLITYPRGRKTTTYVIPSGVTNIESYAFEYTQNLTSITIPTSVKKIGLAAFANSVLTSVVIPDGVDTIESWTFGWCEELASVALPASVKEIKSGAFGGCTGLRSVTVGWTVPPMPRYPIFPSVPVANVQLNVPRGTESTYRSMPVWNEFLKIGTVANAEVDGRQIYTTDGVLYLTLPQPELVRIFDVSGRLLQTFSAPAGSSTLRLKAGYHIVQVGDTAEKVYVN